MPAMSTAIVAVTFSRGAAMRLRQQRQQRRDAAEERKHGVPAQPRGADAQQHLVDRPADDADARHQQTERERGPEQPLASRPGVPPPRDNRDARERRQQQREDAEPGKNVRKRPQVCANNGIENRIRDAEPKPAHLHYPFRPKRLATHRLSAHFCATMSSRFSVCRTLRLTHVAHSHRRRRHRHRRAHRALPRKGGLRL